MNKNIVLASKGGGFNGFLSFWRRLLFGNVGFGREGVGVVGFEIEYGANCVGKGLARLGFDVEPILRAGLYEDTLGFEEGVEYFVEAGPSTFAGTTCSVRFHVGRVSRKFDDMKSMKVTGGKAWVTTISFSFSTIVELTDDVVCCTAIGAR